MTRLPQLAYTGPRIHHVRDDFLLGRGLGLPMIHAPWGAVMAHPLESLAVAAPFLDPWRLIACVDALLTHTFHITGTSARGGFSRSTLNQALSRLPPHSERTRAVRRALHLARTPVLSPRETLVRLIIHAHGLPEPVLNYPVLVGGQCFYLDLAWPEAGIALEYNGSVHSEGHANYQLEFHRLGMLKAAGWDVHVLTSHSLTSPARRAVWLEALKRTLGCEE